MRLGVSRWTCYLHLHIWEELWDRNPNLLYRVYKESSSVDLKSEKL